MYYFGVGDNLSIGLGGALGAVIGASIDGSAPAKIQKTLTANNIYIDKILVNEFSTHE